MKGIYFVKGNKDEEVPQKCHEREENVDFRKIKWLLSHLPAYDGEKTRSSNFFVCLSNAVKFVVGIISIYFSMGITDIFRLHNNFTSTLASISPFMHVSLSIKTVLPTQFEMPKPSQESVVPQST